MQTAGIVVLVILLLLILVAICWVLYTHWRAHRLGLPPPSWTSYIPFHKSNSSSGIQPAPGGVIGWINDRIRGFKNRNVRTATGAYEGAAGAAGGSTARGRTNFGALDPDEAWDARVGNEADNYGPGGYYEEQELGLRPPGGRGPPNLGMNTEYGGSTYNMNLAATPGMAPEGFGGDEERGRPRSRSPGLKAGPNPFDDDAEPSNLSLRGVSPRPIDTAAGPAKGAAPKDTGSGESPTSRRSVFRENM